MKLEAQQDTNKNSLKTRLILKNKTKIWEIKCSAY